MEYTNLGKLAMMQQAIMTDKHDVEDTLLCAMTHRDTAIVVGGVVLLDIWLPEVKSYTHDFMFKLQELAKGRDFFSTRFEEPPDGEQPPGNIDIMEGGEE